MTRVITGGSFDDHLATTHANSAGTDWRTQVIARVATHHDASARHATARVIANVGLAKDLAQLVLESDSRNRLHATIENQPWHRDIGSHGDLKKVADRNRARSRLQLESFNFER
jgi:hypothetical protein